jgi:hypothetical protein
MSKPNMLPLAPAAVAGLLLAGCVNMPWQPPAYESAVKSYYEAHASEKTGRCLAPYIDGFTTIQVVEETQERMVIEARYLYRDRVKDQPDVEDGRPVSECVGYNQRSFVLEKVDDRLAVTEMSGPRRS